MKRPNQITDGCFDKSLHQRAACTYQRTAELEHPHGKVTWSFLSLSLNYSHSIWSQDALNVGQRLDEVGLENKCIDEKILKENNSFMIGLKRSVRQDSANILSIGAERWKEVSLASEEFCNAAQRRHQSPLHLKNATAFCTKLIHWRAPAPLLVHEWVRMTDVLLELSLKKGKGREGGPAVALWMCVCRSVCFGASGVLRTSSLAGIKRWVKSSTFRIFWLVFRSELKVVLKLTAPLLTTVGPHAHRHKKLKHTRHSPI